VGTVVRGLKYNFKHCFFQQEHLKTAGLEVKINFIIFISSAEPKKNVCISRFSENTVSQEPTGPNVMTAFSQTSKLLLACWGLKLSNEGITGPAVVEGTLVKLHLRL
jgi:hypothetical protein